MCPKRVRFDSHREFYFPPSSLCSLSRELTRSQIILLGLSWIAFPTEHKTTVLFPLKHLCVAERVDWRVKKKKKIRALREEGFLFASLARNRMVKFLCTTESCLKLGENGVYADRVCGATHCLCKNRPQYINSTVSAGYNSYRGGKNTNSFLGISGV